MSHILPRRHSAEQTAGCTCQDCDTKLICPRCTKVKNETKQLKHIVCSPAALVAIIAAFLAFSYGLYITNTSACTLKLVCVSPSDCFATGTGLDGALVGERANAVLYTIDHEGEAYTTEVKTITCEIIHESADKKIDCEVKKSQRNQYEISYLPTNLGRHQLHVHIKVEGEHIKGSPFPVTVTYVINGVKKPWGVAVNQRGEIIVSEKSEHCISIFSHTGEKLGSFGSRGTGPGQFSEPRGVTVDDDGNILVTDGTHRIQKFSSENKFIVSVGSFGKSNLQFSNPLGITISPTTQKIAIADSGNARVQILNSDLTFNSSIGSRGNESGQFSFPYDVAFDSAGNLYVTDSINHCIQVFTPEGKFLRRFGKKGTANGELGIPNGISIDSDHTMYVIEHGNHMSRVSVFTHEGKFLTSFGSKGDGPGQFDAPRGITVDKNGVIYVSDSYNNCIQVFRL